MNIPDGPVTIVTVTPDIGSFQSATSPSSSSSLRSSIQPAEREGLYVEDSYGPGPRAMATSSAYIPLARTQETDCFQLQWRQRNIVSL